ncbi:MAG: ATP-binding cassette domain-containing protein [Evtepia gabavorous]
MSIECKDITKQFGSTRALDQVSLTLEPGHIYGLLGNNGAGKSTLLSILTDRQLPDQGTVTVDGQPVRNNDAALHKVFMVGEQNFFPEDMKIKRALHTMTYFTPISICAAPMDWPNSLACRSRKNPGTFHWILLHFSPDLRAQRQHAVCYL